MGDFFSAEPWLCNYYSKDWVFSIYRKYISGLKHEEVRCSYVKSSIEDKCSAEKKKDQLSKKIQLGTAEQQNVHIRGKLTCGPP